MLFSSSLNFFLCIPLANSFNPLNFYWNNETWKKNTIDFSMYMCVVKCFENVNNTEQSKKDRKTEDKKNKIRKSTHELGIHFGTHQPNTQLSHWQCVKNHTENCLLVIHFTAKTYTTLYAVCQLICNSSTRKWMLWERIHSLSIYRHS